MGINYKETFSLVIKATTIHFLLIIVISKGWRVRKVEVYNAFLHGVLNKVVYFELLPDHEVPGCVCCLKKALYELKQTPQTWFVKLGSSLLGLGFTSSKVDSSLFLFQSSIAHIMVLIYVNDILITGDNDIVVQDLIDHLNGMFAIKNLVDLSYFLGIKVQNYENGMQLS